MLSGISQPCSSIFNVTAATSSRDFHVEPFEGANLQPEALAFNGIDPTNPLRGAVSEYDALHAIFKMVRKGMKEQNAWVASKAMPAAAQPLESTV